MPIEVGRSFIVSFCSNYLRRAKKLDTNTLVRLLDEAIGEDYDQWSRQISKGFAWEAVDEMEPYHDVVTYVVEHISQRNTADIEKSRVLLDLARQLDDRLFFFLLVIYADSKNDLEGIRRAYDSAFTPKTPFRVVLDEFKHRSDGGFKAGKHPERVAKQQRDRAIRKDYDLRMSEGLPRRSIVGELTRSYKLPKELIRQIIRKTDGR